MTTRPDTDRLIRAFLEDNRVDLPEHVYDAVRGQIDHKRQRVVIGPWREDQMRKYAIFGIAAAAIVLVAVAGIRFLPANGGVSGPPGPAPTPSLTPGPTPSPKALPQSTTLDAGSYYFDSPGISNVKRLTLTVPAGWVTKGTNYDNFIFKDVGKPGEVQLNAWTVGAVFADACHWSEANSVDVGSADDLMNALAGQQSRTAGQPTSLTVAGFPAKRIELTVSPSLNTTACTNGNLRYWSGAQTVGGVTTNDFSSGLCCAPAGNVDDVYGIDVNGKLLVVVARHYPPSPAQSLAELQSIVDSIQITP